MLVGWLVGCLYLNSQHFYSLYYLQVFYFIAKNVVKRDQRQNIFGGKFDMSVCPHVLEGLL
jgi:hypothetical protein